MTSDLLQIKLPEIFSWSAIMGYLNRTTNEVVYKMIGDKLRRAYKMDGEIYLCEISPDANQEYLRVRILNDLKWTDKVKSYITRYIRDWFDLDTDLTDFYIMAENDSLLSDLIQNFYGLRLVGMPDFYEAITWGILGQQINLTYAYTLKRRFTEKYREAINFEGETYWVYPQPEAIVQSTIEDLRQLKLTQRKAEYLMDISRLITAGKMSKTHYQQFQTAKAAEKEMTKIRGIGPWTANYVLMRCLRLGDAFPMADIGLLNGIKQIENLETKPDKGRLLSLQKDWGSWSAYATFYIWRLLY